MFNIKRGCRFLLYIIKSLFYSPEVLESLAVCCGGAGTERPGPSWVLWGEAPGAMGQVEGASRIQDRCAPPQTPNFSAVCRKTAATQTSAQPQEGADQSHSGAALSLVTLA